jgi:deoxyadenosine/deoxycytidine kinase
MASISNVTRPNTNMSTPQNASRPIICAIEGNIGAGKTTIFNKLKQYFQNTPHVVFMPEPVDIWETVRDSSGKTILEKFYENPKYAFSFQIMAYSTRLAMMRKTIRDHPECKLIICERSLEADHNIFAKMLFESGKIEDVEYQIYEMLFRDTAAEFRLDASVYIDASPEICFQRIAKRARNGESAISLSYLADCNKYYDTWLRNTNAFPVLHIVTNTEATYTDGDVNDCGNQWLQQVIQFTSTFLE